MTEPSVAAVRPARPEICIVAPCYNEAVNLPLFHQEVSTALAGP